SCRRRRAPWWVSSKRSSRNSKEKVEPVQPPFLKAKPVQPPFPKAKPAQLPLPLPIEAGSRKGTPYPPPRRRVGSGRRLPSQGRIPRTGLKRMRRLGRSHDRTNELARSSRVPTANQRRD